MATDWWWVPRLWSIDSPPTILQPALKHWNQIQRMLHGLGWNTWDTSGRYLRNPEDASLRDACQRIPIHRGSSTPMGFIKFTSDWCTTEDKRLSTHHCSLMLSLSMTWAIHLHLFRDDLHRPFQLSNAFDLMLHALICCFEFSQRSTGTSSIVQMSRRCRGLSRNSMT